MKEIPENPLVLGSVFLPRHGEIRRTVEPEPRVLANLANGDALYGVIHEHRRNEIARSLREEIRKTIQAI